MSIFYWRIIKKSINVSYINANTTVEVRLSTVVKKKDTPFRRIEVIQDKYHTICIDQFLKTDSLPINHGNNKKFHITMSTMTSAELHTTYSALMKEDIKPRLGRFCK